MQHNTSTDIKTIFPEIPGGSSGVKGGDFVCQRTIDSKVSLHHRLQLLINEVARQLKEASLTVSSQTMNINIG